MNTLIPQQDSDFIASIEDQLKSTWAKRQVFRTETEMRVSVLDDFKHPTKASKYWQAVMEQSVFYENLKTLSFDYRENEIKINKTKDKLATAEGYKADKLQVKLDRLMFNREQMEQQGRDRIREIKLWQQILSELDDGTFDTTNPNTHQLVSLGLTLSNKIEAIKQSGNSTGDEVMNAHGVFNTVMRQLDEQGLLEKQGDKLLIKEVA